MCLLTKHTGSCKVQVLAAVHVVLTWAQIRTALRTLIDVCVDNPPKASRGGRASGGHQAPIDIGRGGRKDKRTLASTVTGKQVFYSGTLHT